MAKSCIYDPGISPVPGYVWDGGGNPMLGGCIYTSIVDLVSGGCKK